MMLPASVGDLAITMQKAMDRAEFEITGELRPSGPNNELHDQIKKRWEELLYEHGSQNLELRKTPEWDDEVLKRLKQGLTPTDIMVADFAASRSLEASLMSYITTAWTIIETMSGDLWEAAINAHPGTLAHLNGKANRLKRSHDRSSASSKEPRESKTVPLDAIAMHGFDVRAQMGAILRAAKFEFSRFESIREAYASAFDRDFTQIDQALSNAALDALNAVRNLIVHKDGIVDAEFLKKRSTLTSLPKGQVGKILFLDGEIIVALIKPAITAANQLLRAVDDWLAKH
jgi:hypothetical protein